MGDSDAGRTAVTTCAVCGKSVARAGYARHQRTHTGVKKYACAAQNCGKSFSRADALKTHTRFHRSDGAHVCAICNRAFVQPHDLDRHRKSHERRGEHRDALARIDHLAYQAELAALREQLREQAQLIASLGMQLREHYLSHEVDPGHSHGHGTGHSHGMGPGHTHALGPGHTHDLGPGHVHLPDAGVLPPGSPVTLSQPMTDFLFENR